MSIHFKITNPSEGSSSLSFETEKEFEIGGIIGRGQECDWILADDKKVISTSHANIEFIRNEYCITDLSTNGTFHNNPPERLKKNVKTRLKNGDTIKIGFYIIEIKIIPSIKENKLNSIPTLMKETRNNFPPTQISTPTPIPIKKLEIPKIKTEERNYRTEPEVERAFPLPTEPQLPLPQTNETTLFKSFLRGLNMDEYELAHTDPHYVLEMAGKILLEFANGHVDFSRKSTHLKSNLNVNRSLVLTDYLNPFKHLPSGKKALVEMLSRRKDDSWKNPMDSIREVYSENKQHIDGLMSGFQVVLKKLVETPTRIEQQLEQKFFSKILGSKHKSLCWETLKSEFKKISVYSENNNLITYFKNEFEKIYDPKSFD